MLKRLLFISILILAVTGCIKEEEDCDRGLKIQFRYVHNMQNRDLLVEHVRNIRIYIFNENSNLLTDIISVGIQDIARGYISVDTPPGEYTVIAWGGSSNDILRGGYAKFAAANPADTGAALQDTPIAIGITTLEQFRIMLDDDPLTGNPLANATPKKADFDNLFYGVATGITVAGWEYQEVNLDLIQNTSMLKVKVIGLNHLARTALPGMPVEIFLTGKKTVYLSNSRFDPNAPRMLFLPQNSTLSTDENTIEAFIKQQKISTAQIIIDPVLLYLRNTAGSNLMAPLNIVDAIMQIPAYHNQAEIDREDLFVIEIIIAPGDSVGLTVTITVNGWEIMATQPILT
jgi:hypothetical protein